DPNLIQSVAGTRPVLDVSAFERQDGRAIDGQQIRKSIDQKGTWIVRGLEHGFETVDEFTGRFEVAVPRHIFQDACVCPGGEACGFAVLDERGFDANKQPLAVWRKCQALEAAVAR